MHFVVQKYQFPANAPTSLHWAFITEHFPFLVTRVSVCFQLCIFCGCCCNVFNRFTSVTLHCIKGVQQNRSFPKISLLFQSHGACDMQPGWVHDYLQHEKYSVVQSAVPWTATQEDPDLLCGYITYLLCFSVLCFSPFIFVHLHPLFLTQMQSEDALNLYAVFSIIRKILFFG